MKQTSIVNVLSLCIICLDAVSVDGDSGRSPTNSIAEQFKSFVSSPPVIEELVFESKVSPPLRGTNIVDLSSSTNFQRFIARWQPNARSIYQVLPKSMTTNTILNRFSISVFDEKHWNLLPEGILNVWQDDGAVPPRNADPNTIRDADFLLSYRLKEVLNMGVYNLDVGSIRWRENSFSATNAKVRLRFDGNLIVSQNGFPTKLQLRCQARTNVANFEMLYSFDLNVGLPYIPNQIRCVELTNGKIRERGLINIQSIKLATQPAAEAAFVPRTNLSAIPVEMRFYTNGAYYALNGDGRLVRVNSPILNLRRVDENRRLYLVTSAVLSIAIFALVIRAKLKRS